MPDAYYALLDAAIQQLEELKARGVRFVQVSAEGLAELNQSPPERNSATSSAARGATQAETQNTIADHAAVKNVHKGPAKAELATNSPVNSPRAAAGLDLELPGTRPDTVPENAPARAALSPEARITAFAELRQRAMACVKCSHLASSRKNVVFGVGDINAQLMFVGEAPGADEDTQGEPFVGRAGQLLTKIIETMGLRRDAVYIGNILKCRPDTPGQPTGNRKPTPEEMRTCIPFLHEQIDLIQPKVLVALGGTAVEGLLGKGEGIMRLRGKWQTYRGIPLMPTYHPSFVLRQQSLVNKRHVWEDMLRVMEKLGMPISEKQRRFFTTA